MHKEPHLRFAHPVVKQTRRERRYGPSYIEGRPKIKLASRSIRPVVLRIARPETLREQHMIYGPFGLRVMEKRVPGFWRSPMPGRL